MDRIFRRRAWNLVMSTLCVAAAVVAIIPLALILFYVAADGLQAINWEFFTNLPKPVGVAGGGMANAIVGTLTLVALATGFGLPVGLMAGIYLAEFGRGRLAQAIRFLTDVLNGVPSIITGIFVYSLIVLAMGRYSALAGGAALGIIMIPIITRSTEEMLRMVPNSLREASLALGATEQQTVLNIVLRSASGGIVTGVMLAVARAAGETAPVLFTALNNRYWNHGLDQPIASLAVFIYTYGISPFEDWHSQAWGAALVLVVMVLALNITARLVVRARQRR